MFSSGGSANPPFTDMMWGQEFFYDSHAPDELTKIVEEVGFRTVLFDVAEPPDGGRNKGKLAMIVEKQRPKEPDPTHFARGSF